MRSLAKTIVSLVALIAVIMAVGSPVCGQFVPGQKAPVFELADISGKRYNLAAMESHPMTILFFSMWLPDPVRKACWRWMILQNAMRMPT